MTNDNIGIEELNILSESPYEKVEIISGKYLYYLNFSTQLDLLNVLEQYTMSKLIVCIDLLLPLKEEFCNTVGSEYYNFFKKEKRGSQYVQVCIEKKDIRNLNDFFNFIMFIAGLNTFIFIVLDSKGQLHDYLLNDKVRINSEKNEDIIIFDYDRAGAFIFTNRASLKT